jgi:hypothetical protein
MRSEVPLQMRTYLHAISPLIDGVDLGTLGGAAHPLQNRGLARICSSNDEDSEGDIARDGEILLCIHSTNGLQVEMG